MVTMTIGTFIVAIAAPAAAAAFVTWYYMGGTDGE